MDENGTVNYKPAGSGSGSYSIHWKKPTSSQPMVSDCLDIRVRHNLDASAPQQSTFSGYKPSEKKVNTGTHTAPGTGTPKQSYQEMPNVEPTQAQEYALNQAERSASHEWELQCTVVGDPSIKIDGNIQLSGTGTVMDQTYPIDEIMHNFGINGYTTTVNSKGKKGSGGGG
jgi:phage protein D